MSGVIVITEPEPIVEPVTAPPVVVVETAATDPLLDVVTRLTRVEDGLIMLGGIVQEIDVRTLVVQEEVAEVADVVEEVAEPPVVDVAVAAVPEPEPEPEPQELNSSL